MKTRLRIWSSLSLIAMLLISVSCSKDEPGLNDKHGSKDDSGTKRLVRTIEIETNREGTEIYTFSYDVEGKLKMVSADWLGSHGIKTGGLKNTYAMVGNNLILDFFSYEGQKVDEEKYTCTLNSSGMVESMTDIDNNTNTLSYQNGCLSKWVESDAGGEESVQYTWQEGNLIKGRWSDGMVEEYTYYTEVNKMNIEMLEAFYGIELFDCSYVLTSGYFGLRNKNLLKKGYSRNAKDMQSIEYSYQFDKDGYVVGFYAILTFYYDGTEKKTTYTGKVIYY